MLLFDILLFPIYYYQHRAERMTRGYAYNWSFP